MAITNAPSSRYPSGPISSPPRHSSLHALLAFSTDLVLPAVSPALPDGVESAMDGSTGLTGLGSVGNRLVRVNDPAFGRFGLAKGLERDGDGIGRVTGRPSRSAEVDMAGARVRRMSPMG